MSIPTMPINVTRPTRYELVEKIRQHFWDRWHREHVTKYIQNCRNALSGVLYSGNAHVDMWDHMRVPQGIYYAASSVSIWAREPTVTRNRRR
ncbi:unnamed protein product, partial [Iphiclides podalirius]